MDNKGRDEPVLALLFLLLVQFVSLSNLLQLHLELLLHFGFGWLVTVKFLTEFWLLDPASDEKNEKNEKTAEEKSPPRKKRVVLKEHEHEKRGLDEGVRREEG